MPAEEATLHDHSLSHVDRACLIACAEGFQQKHIHVSPLGRYGYTGARLFLVRFDPANVGPQYVVKIDTEETIRSEQRALEDARAYFHDALSWNYAPSVGNGHAAILYRLFASPGGDIQELRDLYQDTGTPVSDVVDVVDRLYAACSAAHMSERRDVQLGVEYKWYLRENRPDRIEAIFGSSADTIQLLGRPISNPCTLVKELSSEHVSASLGFVHGDLHPNNVVIDKHGSPSFIDFAWAHTGDILVDYVLMESSLRFLLFPQHVHWEEHRQVGEWLALEEGPSLVLEGCTRGDLKTHVEHYRRMATCVQTVRAAARSTSGDGYEFKDYLRAQLFILYGLSKLDAYPFPQTVDALGSIAGELA